MGATPHQVFMALHFNGGGKFRLNLGIVVTALFGGGGPINRTGKSVVITWRSCDLSWGGAADVADWSREGFQPPDWMVICREFASQQQAKQQATTTSFSYYSYSCYSSVSCLLHINCDSIVFKTLNTIILINI